MQEWARSEGGQALFNTQFKNLDDLDVELLLENEAVAEEFLCLLGANELHVEGEKGLQRFEDAHSERDSEEFVLGGRTKLKHTLYDCDMVWEEEKHLFALMEDLKEVRRVQNQLCHQRQVRG